MLPPPSPFNSSILAIFPLPVQQQILEVLESELEDARNICLKALLGPMHSLRLSEKEKEDPVNLLNAWNEGATSFVDSVGAYLKTRVPTKRGYNFCQITKQVLEDAFTRSPFLNKAECRLVAKAAGISTQQVRTWFQNKRNRSPKRPIRRRVNNNRDGKSSITREVTALRTEGAGNGIGQWTSVEEGLSKNALPVPQSKVKGVGHESQAGDNLTLATMGLGPHTTAVSQWFDTTIANPLHGNSMTTFLSANSTFSVNQPAITQSQAPHASGYSDQAEQEMLSTASCGWSPTWGPREENSPQMNDWVGDCPPFVSLQLKEACM